MLNKLASMVVSFLCVVIYVVIAYTPSSANVGARVTDTEPVYIYLQQTPEKSAYIPSKEEDIFLEEYNKHYTATDYADLLALSTVLYCEARGEPWVGIVAVADTVRNRVTSRLFPNSYSSVIKQGYQFSCIKHTSDLYKNISLRNVIDKRMFVKLIKLANDTISNNRGNTTAALFYHAVEITPSWASAYSKTSVIGRHVFYTTNKL